VPRSRALRELKNLCRARVSERDRGRRSPSGVLRERVVGIHGA
jgi:hypothetical protein